MLPPRVMWMKRYVANAGVSVQSVVVSQEAERFRRYESAAIELEKAFVAAPASFPAALAAARLGIDFDVTTLPPEQRKTVEQAMREAQVAYL